jgi:hypothetical protein
LAAKRFVYLLWAGSFFSKITNLDCVTGAIAASRWFAWAGLPVRGKDFVAAPSGGRDQRGAKDMTEKVDAGRPEQGSQSFGSRPAAGLTFTFDEALSDLMRSSVEVSDP